MLAIPIGFSALCLAAPCPNGLPNGLAADAIGFAGIALMIFGILRGR